jgi:putative transposase
MRTRVQEVALKSQKQFSRWDPTHNLSVQLALLDGMEATKQGFLALAVQAGLQVIQTMMREEVNTLVGPQGQAQPGAQGRAPRNGEGFRHARRTQSGCGEGSGS